KLNQYESECIRRRIEKSGLNYSMPEEGADFCIINTCTVTAKTDARCRNAIRRAKRANPDSVIIVTGCQVEISPRELEGMQEVDFIIPNAQKGRISELIAGILNNPTEKKTDPELIIGSQPDTEEERIGRFSNHARAFIKIQNGCNAFCSYCIIPYARGRSRSLPPDRIIDQVRKLASNGYQEIILTGIHIGRYGEECSYEIGITGLLELILKKTGGTRIRLSSIEPNEVDMELIELASSTERIAPHFHIPLQSGDDHILDKMNRRYRREYFREQVYRIHNNIPDVSIGTDIIVGFPGEKESHFENTRNFLDTLDPVNYFHVFSYSDRPGTRASEMGGKVDPAEKKRRSSILIEMGKKKKNDFIKSQEGKNRLAVVLEKDGERYGFYRAITGNYCNMTVRSGPENMRKLVPVRIDRMEGKELLGEITGKPFFEESQ
ncbi:MAG: tRNA (N(6)-L-threonylcarbamoyladenosine(37)-C(2))-methylthiotransferase MtaB, partial [Candidatus Latescibacteria bacterium]|nr:tRNA (N(6)-L-threonylcarbamoyladenosine(37)-C(2))-methylthiotransferase MtaB [bacterium]MBD3423327.1 tRNA (N(6)-L-threonylcarbamoyladenosine(37)-C(2))-methylthiotransferase MtaB [Candidatus Latescibacterota bacterium]